MNKNGDLVSTDEEQAEVLNNIFASVFTGNLCPCSSRVKALQNRDQRSKAPSKGRSGS